VALKRIAISAAAIAAAIVGALAASGAAPGVSGSTATRAADGSVAARCAVQKKRLAQAKKKAPAARRAYFRTHRKPKARRRFVKKQRAQIKKLEQALSRCLRRSRPKPKPSPPIPPPQPSQPTAPPAPPLMPCGDAEAVSAVAIPQRDADVRGTVLTVTTSSDATNGDVATPALLLAAPGTDGISLREALEVTNNAPGQYTIQFAPHLSGATIRVGSPAPSLGELPPLTGGGVFVNGDVDGDSKPDVSLVNEIPPGITTRCGQCGFTVSSSGNRLNALTLHGFSRGVFFAPNVADINVLPTNQTYANNVVSGLVLSDIAEEGISFQPYRGRSQCASNACQTRNSWVDTSLIANTIDSRGSGINLGLELAVGDVAERVTIAYNTIRIAQNERAGPRVGIGLSAGGGVGSRDNRISNALIAYNSIEGLPLYGIRVSSGDNAGGTNSVEGVRIVGNRIHKTIAGMDFGGGIAVQTGDSGSDYLEPDRRPIVYPEDNALKNVEISGNTLTGEGALTIDLQGAVGGGARNAIHDVRIAANTIRGLSRRSVGVSVVAGASGGLFSRSSVSNEISNVSVQANSVTLVTDVPFDAFPAEGVLQAGGLSNGGILLAGGNQASAGKVADVRLTSNCIDVGIIGINVVAGFGQGSSPFAAADNAVSHIEVRGNVVARPPGLLSRHFPDVKGINLAGGVSNASGNRVSCITMADNVVAGSPGVLSAFDNIGAGASGNVATTGGC
jgi:hypothetical protein